MQEIQRDEQGALRFKQNAIVTYLLDHGPFDMNHLAVQTFSAEDREQFAQLVGYSVNGFLELSYVTNETARNALESARELGG